MLALLGTLVPDELPGLISANACNVSDQIDLLCGQGEEVQRRVRVLEHLQRFAFNPFGCHTASSAEWKMAPKRRCSHAWPASLSMRKALVLERVASLRRASITKSRTCASVIGWRS